MTQSDGVFADIRTWLREQLAADRAPCVSVAVGRGDDVIFSEALGLADVGDGRLATADTAFVLASVTKPITATCIALLAQDHAIDLDQPIERYLSDLRLASGSGLGEPTVKQVLQHRGGLGLHHRQFYEDEDQPIPSLGRTVERYGSVFSPPGRRFIYSNLGYGLLEEVVRVTTGQTLLEFAKERVFPLLEMSSAWLGAHYDGESAVRYTRDGRAYPPYRSEWDGSGYAWSTASDLVRFGLAHAGGSSVLSAATVSDMQTGPAIESNDDDLVHYGLGWAVREVGGMRIVSHAGGMAGVSTLLALVPDEGLVVAVLTSVTSSTLPPRTVSFILSRIAERAPEDLEERLLSDYESISPALLSSSLANLEGDWNGNVSTHVGDIPLTLRIRSDGATASLAGGGSVSASLFSAPSWDIGSSIPAQLPTPDAEDRAPGLRCYLKRADEVLGGIAVAEPMYDGDDHPGSRVGNELTHRCELARAR